MSTQRLKNESDVLAIRNDTDSDYAPLKAKSLYLTDGTPDIGDVGSQLTNLLSVFKDTAHGRFTQFWDEAFLVTGTRGYSRITGMDYGYGVHAGAAVNNEMKISFSADISMAGTFHFHVVTNNASGIMTVSIDGTSIGTIDLYSAAQVLNVDKTLTVDLGEFSAGRHLLNVKANGKNASSSNHFLIITKVWFYDGG
jgi:hypothetical protein